MAQNSPGLARPAHTQGEVASFHPPARAAVVVLGIVFVRVRVLLRVLVGALHSLRSVQDLSRKRLPRRAQSAHDYARWRN